MSKSHQKLHEKLYLMKMNLAESAGIQEGMKVLDVGCGQGTFTVCVAMLVTETGRVTAVDIDDTDLDKLNENLDRYHVRNRATFVKVDAAELQSVFAQESFDMAVSYRLIEELKQPKQLSKIVSSIARVVRRGGKVVMFELSTETKDIAEENLIRLHRDIGTDYFPSKATILHCLRDANLNKVDVETLPTNISYSGKMFLESSISQDELWPEFKERIMKELWPSIERYGLKYPDIKMFSGQKPRYSMPAKR